MAVWSKVLKNWNGICVTQDLSARPNFIAMTPSSDEEISPLEILLSKFRESRMNDAENIRQDFIKSKGILIPPHVVIPITKGTTQDDL